MCGIVGIIDWQGRRPIDSELVRRMTESLAHRGPDGSGYYYGPGVAMGHRRLAIIDVAHGQQPLFNEDRTVVVSFNGQIYNYRELMRDLQAAGHHFATHSDTEVIVHAWEEWGQRCVERFRGMFAFALWDENRQEMFLARDRLGKKPLYYAEIGGGFVLFASELKALLIDPRIERKLDPTAIEDYLAYGYVPETKSIYYSVKKLPPAHSMTIRRGRGVSRARAYWDISFGTRSRTDLNDACEELVGRLGDAVEMRLISEVPLGGFLSGGVDSSAVISLMAERSGQPVNSFAIGFKQTAYDESRYAEAVAARWATRHRSSLVDAEDFALVDRLARVFDEPFADSSAIPTYQLCSVARREVTVALSGDGGDELFAGYRRYRWHAAEERVRQLLPGRLRSAILGPLAHAYPQFDWAPRPLRLRATLGELAVDSLDGYFHNVSVLDDEIRRRLCAPAFRRELQGYHAKEYLAAYYNAAPADDPVGRAQYTDLKTYLPGDILTKVDRTSMASSLEVRAPILDHVFVEWAAGLPASFKLRGAVGKYVLKRALEPRLPRDILYRPKQGFSVPLADWFRGPLRRRVREALNAPRLHAMGWFDLDYLRHAFEEHASGRRDYASLIWSMLMLDAFLRDVHESAPAAPPTAEVSLASAGS